MRSRLNSWKHAGLCLALFAFGTVVSGLGDAQASVFQYGSILNGGLPNLPPPPVIPSPTSPSAPAGFAVQTPKPTTTPYYGTLLFGSAFTGFANTTTAVTALGFFTPTPTASAAVTVPTATSAPNVLFAPTLDPEPASVFLFGSGLAAIFAVRRKRLSR